MKTSFEYDGTKLYLILTVEDKTEGAMAALLEKLTQVSVHVEYERYGYQSSDYIKFIQFRMTAPDVETERND